MQFYFLRCISFEQVPGKFRIFPITQRQKCVAPNANKMKKNIAA